MTHSRKKRFLFKGTGAQFPATQKLGMCSTCKLKTRKLDMLQWKAFILTIFSIHNPFNF